MPKDVRKATVLEALRVLKPGGKCVFVDYHRPSRLNPFKIVMAPILAILEPFALDMWKAEISEMLPAGCKFEKDTYFGGLYQRVVVTKD